MSMTATRVSLGMGVPDAGDFIVGTSLVDGADEIGDGLTTVTSDVVRVSVRRGRFSQSINDPFEPGSITVILNNEDRTWDPTNTSGTYYDKIRPGRDVFIETGPSLPAYDWAIGDWSLDDWSMETADPPPEPVFRGVVLDWDLEYEVSGRSVAVLRGTDALGVLGALEFDAWTNTAVYPGDKINNVLDRNEVAWAAALRNISSGRSLRLPGDSLPVLLQSDAVSWGSSVLNYLQLIARSGFFGMLYASRDGFVVFDDDWVLVNRSLFAASLDNEVKFGGSDIPFQSIALQTGSETLYSSVSVDREGGTVQTSTVADLVAWQDANGPARKLPIAGLLLASDDDAAIPAGSQQFADELLDWYDAPVVRCTEISVELAGLTTSQQSQVLGIEIGDVVTVSFQPNGFGDTFVTNNDHHVQGIAHEITPGSHVVTLSLHWRKYIV